MDFCAWQRRPTPRSGRATRLAPFMAEHPALHIEFSLDDRRQDLVRDAIDVAIRFGILGDSLGHHAAD